jgi:hypothetical protein
MESTGDGCDRASSKADPVNAMDSFTGPLSSSGDGGGLGRGHPTTIKKRGHDATQVETTTTTTSKRDSEQSLGVASLPAQAPTGEDAPSPARPLPSDFRPSEYSVVIGKGPTISQHRGNQRLRFLAGQVLQSYTRTNNRRRKTEVLDQLLMDTKAICPVGAFVRQVGSDSWVEVSDSVAREKIGYVLRDLAHTHYRSSTQSKSAVRRQRRKIGDDESQRKDGIRAMLASPSSGNINNQAQSSQTVQHAALQPAPPTHVREQQSSPVPSLHFQSQTLVDGLSPVVATQQHQVQANLLSNLILHQASTVVANPHNYSQYMAQILGVTADGSKLTSFPPALCGQATTAQEMRSSPALNQEPLPNLAPPWQIVDEPTYLSGVVLSPDHRPTEHQLNEEIQNIFGSSAGASYVPSASAASALPPHVSVAEAVSGQAGRRIDRGAVWQAPHPIFKKQKSDVTNEGSKIPATVVGRSSPYDQTYDRETIGSTDDPWTLMLSSLPSASDGSGSDHGNMNRDSSHDTTPENKSKT